MSDENVVVPPSEDNGNVPLETPSEPTKPATPADEGAPVVTPPTTDPEPKVELFKLPDGREVDAATVAQEYKNLLGDYTRKSQELAKYTGGNPPATPDTGNLPSNNSTAKVYENPDWQPTSYKELIDIAKGEVKADLEREQRAEVEARQALENEVVNQITELKTADPNLNENALFTHAVNYGFKDLRLAYKNMKDMSAVVKKTQATTAQNIAKRNDPVSVSPGASGARPNPSNFGTAVDFLRSLK